MLSKFFKGLYFEQNSGSGSGDAGQSDDQSGDKSKGGQGAPATLEDWVSAQSEDVKKVFQPLFEAHVDKLQKTVKATRDERDDLSRQLRDAMKKLDKNGEDFKTFEGIADKLDEASKKSEFYEDALSMGCKNVKAAYAVLKTENLFTKNGAVDWNALKAEAPEFFGDKKQAVKGKTAGEGTGQQPSGTKTMNDYIREKANRNSITVTS